jgi:hypothetical protein
MVEAFPDDTVPRYLVGDRDRIYGHDFITRVNGLGDPTSSDIGPESLAELLHGTDYRKYPPRMLEPCDRD